MSDSSPAIRRAQPNQQIQPSINDRCSTSIKWKVVTLLFLATIAFLLAFLDSSSTTKLIIGCSAAGTVALGGLIAWWKGRTPPPAAAAAAPAAPAPVSAHDPVSVAPSSAAASQAPPQPPRLPPTVAAAPAAAPSAPVLRASDIHAFLAALGYQPLSTHCATHRDRHIRNYPNPIHGHKIWVKRVYSEISERGAKEELGEHSHLFRVILEKQRSGRSDPPVSDICVNAPDSYYYG